MKETKNVYAISIEFEPNSKYNRQIFVLASTYEGALEKFKSENHPALQENEKIRCVTIIAEDVIY